MNIITILITLCRKYITGTSRTTRSRGHRVAGARELGRDRVFSRRTFSGPALNSKHVANLQRVSTEIRAPDYAHAIFLLDLRALLLHPLPALVRDRRLRITKIAFLIYI